MTGHLPELHIGWHAVDPGPPPRSSLLDTPPIPGPTGDIVVLHRAWRAQVEQDEQRLATQHALHPVWYPVPKSGVHRIVPVLGGTPATWGNLIASLVIAADLAGFGDIRVANLLQWSVLDPLRRIGDTARKSSMRFDDVGPGGSTVDLFALPSVNDLAALVVDVLRVAADPQGRRDSAREKQDLLSVAATLDPPVTLARLSAALEIALGQASAQPPPGISPKEHRSLRDFHATVVRQRRTTADRLDGLSADVRDLVMYSRVPNASGTVVGNGPIRVRAFQLASRGGIHEFEVGRELLARALTRVMSRPSTGLEMLIVAGADKLAPEVLEALMGAAERESKQLVLLFSELTPAAERTLGHAGSGFAVFLRLPNANDARIAAEHLGRDFTFVVNGISISESQTLEWNESCAESRSSTSTHGTNRGTNRGHSGLALSFSRSFGSSVSNGFTQGQTTQRGQSSGTQRGTNVSYGRVHEYVLEPDVFQQIEDDMMLVVEGRTVVLACCDYRIRHLPTASAHPLAIP